MPAAVLQRDRENIHDGMVERLAARFRIHLLRIVGAGADHIMGVMAGMDHDPLDLGEIADLAAPSAREVDQRLALIFGRMLLGVGIEDGALGLALAGKRHLRIRPSDPPSSQAMKPSSPS